MGTTTLLNKISRSETYPKVISVSASDNKAYLSLNTDSWTVQMLHELPSIRITLYKPINSVNTRYIPVSFIMYTNDPKCVGIYDVPSEFDISIEPLFDMNCIKSHNQLVYNGIEEGPIWNDYTDTFNLELKFSSSST